MQAKEVHVARHHTALYNEHDIAVLTLHNTNLSMTPAKACCNITVMLTQEEDVSPNLCSVVHSGMQTLATFHLAGTGRFSRISKGCSKCTFA